MKKICVIIPMYNFSAMTSRCIYLTRQMAGVEHTILVVDDGSHVPFVDDRVEVLRLEDNSGFTNAVNQGILWCKDRFDYICLLNNDTEPQENFLKYLYDAMEENNNIGIAASTRIKKDPDGKQVIENYACDLMRGFQIYTHEDLPEEIIYCDWIPLTSALMSIEMIRYIGLLDRNMRNHCSDNDYCIRANQNGYNVALIPKSRIFHHHETTTRASGINPSEDQKVLMQKLSGAKYAELMNRLPLDGGDMIWGKLQFMTYVKDKE